MLIRPNDKPWYNIGLRKLKRKVNRHCKKVKLKNTNHHWTLYKNIQSEYQIAIKEAKENSDSNLMLLLLHNVTILDMCSKSQLNLILPVMGPAQTQPAY